MASFLFLPESAYGPTNNCIGIADVLRRRGHRVVFAAEASWRGRLATLGFEEDLVDLAPPAPGQDAGQYWKDFVADTAPQFRRPTIEQLETVVRPIWQGLVDGVRYSHDQLTGIVRRSGADVLVEDNVVCFPALLTAGVPYVRIVSCNPLEIGGADLPPAFSGYPTDDRTGWAAFRREYRRVHEPLWREFADWVVGCGAAPLPHLEFIHSSPALNLYVYPAELDYTDRRPLAAHWQRLESSVRATEAGFELPERLRHGDGALVYLSLGSLGSADVELMGRLIATLAGTRHRYLVSTGPRHAELELAGNMAGAPFLPQTGLLPLVDLVITHGGNNTTTEAVHFGKPMVVLPLFWDQYDNAQRVAERGFGVRLDTYGHAPAELVAAVDRVAGDAGLARRVASAGRRVRGAAGTERAADLLERVAAP